MRTVGPAGRVEVHAVAQVQIESVSAGHDPHRMLARVEEIFVGAVGLIILRPALHLCFMFAEQNCHGLAEVRECRASGTD